MAYADFGVKNCDSARPARESVFSARLMAGFDERERVADPTDVGSHTIGKNTFWRKRGVSVTSYLSSCCVGVGDSTQTATSTRLAKSNFGIVVNFTHRPACCPAPVPSCVSIFVTGTPDCEFVRLHVAPDALRMLVWSST